MTAQPANILPFPATKPPTVDDLVVQWLDAKRQEDAANKRRVEIEAQICELHPPREEGSSTVELAGGMKLTLTGKLTYKAVDLEKLQTLALQLPPGLRPVKTEVKLDEAGAKYLRAKEPQLWALIAPAIEVKPAKTSVKVGL